MLDRIRQPKLRVRMALVLVVGSTIAWPVTSVTVFSSEPQGVLGLSWFAIILTAIDILSTSDTRKAVDANDD